MYFDVKKKKWMTWSCQMDSYFFFTVRYSVKVLCNGRIETRRKRFENHLMGFSFQAYVELTGNSLAEEILAQDRFCFQKTFLVASMLR